MYHDSLKCEDFILPARWCVKPDKTGIVQKYFNKQSNNSCYTDSFENEYFHRYNLDFLEERDIMIPADARASFCSSIIRKGYTEITIEEFKKYVLKDITLDNLIEGEIYYLVQHHGNTPWIIKFHKIDSKYLYNKGCIALNTKVLYPESRDNSWGNIAIIKSLRLATLEEKKWLNVCIKQNRFIPIEKLSDYDDSGDLIVERIESCKKINEEVTEDDYIPAIPTLLDRDNTPLIVGEVYKHYKMGDLAYYCGINIHKVPIFELIYPIGMGYKHIPIKWKSKASNTYWGYKDINKEFSIYEEEYENLLDIEVGDIVRCTFKYKSDFSKYPVVGWKAGLEFKVHKIRKLGVFNIYLGAFGGNGVYSDTIKLVKRGENNKYKDEKDIKQPINDIDYRLNLEESDIYLGQIDVLEKLDIKLEIEEE